MDYRLEVVRIPVSDVDRAKDFYQGLGWRLDFDIPRRGWYAVGAGDPARVGVLGLLQHRDRAGPGPGGGRHRRGPGRADRARRRSERGIPAPMAPSGSPARHRTTRATARTPRSMTRTATAGWSRRSPPACLAGRYPCWRPTARWRPWPTRCAARRRRTAGTRPKPGSPTQTGRTGTRSTWPESGQPGA